MLGLPPAGPTISPSSVVVLALDVHRSPRVHLVIQVEQQYLCFRILWVNYRPTESWQYAQRVTSKATGSLEALLRTCLCYILLIKQ